MVNRNPFYAAYLFGELNATCCFPYMAKGAYEIVQANLNRIEIHTCSINDYLATTRCRFSKLSLLDHMD